MRRIQSRSGGVALLVAIAATAAPVSARDKGAVAIPWKTLEHGKHLSAAARKQATAAMRSVRGYHRCRLPIARCLSRRRSRAPVAWLLADYIAFLAGKGLDERGIQRVLELRRESARPSRVHHIPLGGIPRYGAASAPVKIVEYADFRCPHCAQVSPLLEKLVDRMKGKVAVYFKPYPLRPRGPSIIAARAALAAQRQGKFWKMHDLLFANRDKQDESGVEQLARRAGLKLASFRAAMKDRRLLAVIEKSKIEGLRLGIKGTPTLYFNGKPYRLRKDAYHLEQRAREELLMLDDNRRASKAD